MKRQLGRLVHLYRNSRYTRPTLIILGFFAASGGLSVFLESRTNDQFRGFMDGLWWTIITFSTTGYGDKVPETIGGRILAIVTIFVGVGAMSLLSGALASWTSRRLTGIS